MTQTSTPAAKAAVTLAHLATDEIVPVETAYLNLIGWAVTELKALEAGMVNATLRQRYLSNLMWTAQYEALTAIVKAALKDGVDAGLVMRITHA